MLRPGGRIAALESDWHTAVVAGGPLKVLRAHVRQKAEVATLLLYEIDRAQLVSPWRMPPDVVAMHSYVEFRDEATGAVRQVQLVYPHEADIDAGRISIPTLVGSALIGMVAGNSILWPTQLGHKRMLTVLRVSSQPFDEPYRFPVRPE